MTLPEISPVVLGALAVFGVFVAAARGQKRKTEALQRSGLLPSEGQGTDEDIRRLIEAREMIEAIKLYRTLHGSGLKEAKEAVEKIRSEMTGKP